MIVEQTKGGWQIIYHRAHALLAAEIAAHWRAEFRPVRWAETLAAVSTHDDMEREWEAEDHLTEAGTPRHFTIEGGTTSLAGLIEVTTYARYRSRWVALLNSMHQSFLNEPRRGQQAKMDAFLDEQLGYQREWRRALKVHKDEAEQAYALMQWCDRLSLILCGGELPARERALEISNGPDGVRYDVMQREDGSVSVTPWPFDAPRFPLTVEFSSLTAASFKNNTDFQRALAEAHIDTLTWDFSEKPLKPAERKEASTLPN